jgi:cullin 2
VTAGLNHLAESVESHIKKEGLESLRSLKPETAHIEFVDNVMHVYKKYKEVVNEVFKCDQQFISALDKACTAIINFKSCPKTPCRSPELVNQYSTYSLYIPWFAFL